MSDAAVRGTEQGDESGALYLPVMCKVESVEDLTPSEKLFRITRPDGQGFGHRPGQFMQISVFGIGEAPISVSSSPTRGNYLEFGIRKAGELTGVLHDDIKPGDTFGIRGPFGTCFDVELLNGKDLILVAGGCGLAPLRSLIQYCEDRRDEFGKISILYGSKSPQDMLYKDEIVDWENGDAFDMYSTVDNITEGTCWDGNVGLITTLVPPLDIDPKNTMSVICGPPIMYKFVIQELYKKGLENKDIIVSLERYMKCGVGKCGHCTIEHKYCCLDGPVFRLDEVIDLKGAI